MTVRKKRAGLESHQPHTSNSDELLVHGHTRWLLSWDAMGEVEAAYHSSRETT